ncbi:MAG: abortive infection system antitoxin AbiGi family protein [Anaerolineae bacterium]|nr:abortive infection system antitoxin AbiGi family protein [Anaerolineae bacterium]
MQFSSAPYQPNYVSEELTHFVGRSLLTKAAQYELLKKILIEGKLRNPSVKSIADSKNNLTMPLQGDAVFANATDGRIGEVVVHMDGSVKGDNMLIPSIVCFCDIPDDELSLHMSKYSEFGIGFQKSFLIPLDVRPVFYLPLASISIIGDLQRPQWQSFDNLIKELFGLITFQIMQELKRPGLKPNQPSPQMTRLSQMFEFLTRDVFGFVKVFDDTLSMNDPKNYYMEREWRSTASISFQLNNISSIILPTEFIDQFLNDFSSFNGNVKSVDQKTIIRAIRTGKP